MITIINCGARLGCGTLVIVLVGVSWLCNLN